VGARSPPPRSRNPQLRRSHHLLSAHPFSPLPPPPPPRQRKINELEESGARKLEQVLAGWRGEMAQLRGAALRERESAERRWHSASRDASAAAAWHEQAVGGTRWYWERADNDDEEQQQPQQQGGMVGAGEEEEDGNGGEV
jgi:hypothetical protein